MPPAGLAVLLIPTKSLPELRYIIAYEVDEEPGVLNILRVIHTSREWLPGTWPAKAKPR